MGEIRMRGKGKWAAALLGAVLLGLAGCGRAPESLAGTAWKITELTAPDGTQYDEAAYDAIVGATVYRFDGEGYMSSSVAGESAGMYSYVYEDGEVVITAEDFECPGSVGQNRMKLRLGEQGEAVLSLITA